MEISLSVTDLVSQIKSLLEGEFRHVMVEGEISNLTSSSSGHYYFSISDKDSGLSCALFKMEAFRNPVVKKLKDGDKVCCFGKVGVYQKRGTFQLIVESLQAIGKGDLKEQFELLKKKLSAEGFFDLSKKKKIPALPKRIALITAENGAALQDFLKVFKRRSLWMDVLVVPALVQGETAPASIIEALKLIERYQVSLLPENKIDTVVLTRGGGSMEDLWAFNSEKLVRAIAEFSIPIVSAVGHQVDYTLSDFVCDKRCETPTAAAEELSEEQMRLKEKMKHLKSLLENRANILMADRGRRLARAHPQAILNGLWRLHNEKSQRIDDAIFRLEKVIQDNLMRQTHRLEKKGELLQVLNPRHVLNRGFCFIRSEKGHVLASKEQFEKIPLDKIFSIEFSDGKSEAQRVVSSS